MIILFVVVVGAAMKSSNAITDVHLVFMNHLDVGFDGIDPQFGFAANVINKYFQVYFPAAVNTSMYLHQRNGTERLIYTSHSWLVSLYLNCDGAGIPNVVAWQAVVNCPTAQQKAAFEQAIRLGYITWHAFPFNAEPELMDASWIAFGVKLAHDLDDIYHGGVHRTVVSQRDVPGMTRASVPHWVKNGVKMITVGVNGASAPPAVPNQFVWLDRASNTSVLALFHAGGYGIDSPQSASLSDLAIAPGTGHALAPCFRGDNAGPPSVNETIQFFDALRRLVPGARLRASSWDEFVPYLEQSRASLPVIDSEIGDTWIHGSQADAKKIAQFRAVSRWRTECEAIGQCSLSDARYFNFSRLLIKVAEHTWGGDNKKFLPDYADWSNDLFHASLNTPMYNRFVATWTEQRAYIVNGLVALGNHPYAGKLKAMLDEINAPAQPSTTGFVKTTRTKFNCNSTVVEFDLAIGGIVRITNLLSGDAISFADGFGVFVYQTLNSTDYDNFFNEYIYCATDRANCLGWATLDFTKPNISSAGAQSTQWHALATHLYVRSSNRCHFRLLQTMPDGAVRQSGAPEVVQTDFEFDASGTSLALTTILFNKTATRLPEAGWVIFRPTINNKIGIFAVEKLGVPIDVRNVVRNGSVHEHAATACEWRADRTSASAAQLRVVPHDAALARLDALLPLPVPLAPSSPSRFASSLAFNLFNNAWATNYPMWQPFVPADSNMKFRFTVKLM